MRKLPILLFTAVFALSLALPAYAAESSNEELKAASQYLNSHGIMVGDGEGNMNFSAPLTRAHLATILARLHGGSGQVEESRDFYAAQCQFQDVPDWARQYAGYCAYHGLMVGYGDGLFGAEDPVTPAAACTVILRYLALPDLVWDYNSACSTACDLGLSEPAMTAQGTISRGDLAVMLYRALTGNFQGTSAGAAGASVSISSYKGNILKAGTRSGLLVYPSDAQNRAVLRSRYPMLTKVGRQQELITQITWRSEQRSLPLSIRSGRNTASPQPRPISRSWTRLRTMPRAGTPGTTARRSVSLSSLMDIPMGSAAI